LGGEKDLNEERSNTAEKKGLWGKKTYAAGKGLVKRKQLQNLVREENSGMLRTQEKQAIPSKWGTDLEKEKKKRTKDMGKGGRGHAPRTQKAPMERFEKQENRWQRKGTTKRISRK